MQRVDVLSNWKEIGISKTHLNISSRPTWLLSNLISDGEIITGFSMSMGNALIRSS